MERLDGVHDADDLERRPWRARPPRRRGGPTLHRRLAAVPVGDLVRAGWRPASVRPTSILHLDFHPDNIMLTPDGPVVFDWTNATIGPAAADVAQSLDHRRDERPSTAVAVIGAARASSCAAASSTASSTPAGAPPPSPSCRSWPSTALARPQRPAGGGGAHPRAGRQPARPRRSSGGVTPGPERRCRPALLAPVHRPSLGARRRRRSRRSARRTRAGRRRGEPPPGPSGRRSGCPATTAGRSWRRRRRRPAIPSRSAGRGGPCRLPPRAARSGGPARGAALMWVVRRAWRVEAVR